MEKIAAHLEELNEELTGIQQVTLFGEIQMCGCEGRLSSLIPWVQILALRFLLLWASLPCLKFLICKKGKMMVPPLRVGVRIK